MPVRRAQVERQAWGPEAGNASLKLSDTTGLYLGARPSGLGEPAGGPVFITPCMPDGSPAPYLLTFDELVTFLRIQTRFPKDTIAYYRKLGLRPVQVSRRVLYPLSNVLQFLVRLEELRPR